MDMNTIYMIAGASLFILPVMFMLGYVHRGNQQLHANALQREHLESVDAKWRELLNDAKNHAAVYESSWKSADQYRHALVAVLNEHGLWDFDIHGDSPLRMLAHLTESFARMALDPTVSQKAKNLHTRGVRAGAKKGRAQMQKLMQKSIDNQADTINKLYSMYDDSVAVRQRFKDAVINALNDKVALPGVRKSIREAINVECERLRLVATKTAV